MNASHYDHQKRQLTMTRLQLLELGFESFRHSHTQQRLASAKKNITPQVYKNIHLLFRCPNRLDVNNRKITRSIPWQHIKLTVRTISNQERYHRGLSVRTKCVIFPFKILPHVIPTLVSSSFGTIQVSIMRYLNPKT